MNKLTRLRSWRTKLVGIAFCLMAFALSANAQHTLTLTSTANDGAAMVSVSSNAATYEDGSQVVLSVTPHEGYEFLRWDGDVTATESTITVTMDGNKSIRSRIAQYVSLSQIGSTNYILDEENKEIILKKKNSAQSTDIIYPDYYTIAGIDYSITRIGIYEYDPPARIYYSNNHQITSMKLPGQLRFLGTRSIFNTGGDNGMALEAIDIPSSVQTIGEYCFWKKNTGYSSKKIIFGENSQINYIGKSSFSRHDDIFPIQLPTERDDATAVWYLYTDEGLTTGKSLLVDGVMQSADNGKYCAAVWTPRPKLNITAEGGMVSQSKADNKIKVGDDVILTATPSTDFTFAGWSGDVTVTDATITVTMDADKNITANFTPDAYYTMNITAQNGTVTSNPDITQFPNHSIAYLTAAPNANYEFVNWTGDISATEATISVTMDSNLDITANFSYTATYSMNITAMGGAVTKSPDMPFYYKNDIVVLTATADDHYTFENWSGDVSGTEATLTVTIDADKTIAANFEQVMYSMNVTAVGGTVTKSPDQATYTFGTVVELTVATDAGYQFIDWSTNNSTDATITVTVDGNTDVTANFKDLIFELTATTPFSSMGTVTISPDKAHYDRGEEVILTATPLAGHLFVNWTGDATNAASTITITMDKVKDITANFRYAMYAIKLSGTNGTVTKTPDKQLYFEGEKIVLSATPDAKYKFDGYYGIGINETEAVFTLTVTRSLDIAGIFTNLPIILNITEQTGGTVTIAPDLSKYTKDQLVTLTAVPSSANFRFDGWVGDIGANVNSDDLSITITMSEAKDLVAQFVNMTAIDQVENTIAVAVYPNPSQALFTVSMQDDAIGTYAIYTLAGQLVQSGAAEGEFSFDLSSQAKGIYALKLTTNKGVAVQKIVLEK